MAAAKNKLLRNLTHVTVQLRFGSKKEPYHIKLQPRGMRGDVVQLPADLTQHPSFVSNQGVLFEVITQKAADTAAKGYAPGGIIRPKGFEDLKLTVERDSDTTVTVATLDISDSGKITESNRYRGPIRSRQHLEPSPAEVAGSEHGPELTDDNRKIPSQRKPRVPKTNADNAETELPTFKGVERG